MKKSIDTAINKYDHGKVIYPVKTLTDEENPNVKKITNN